MCNIRKQGTFIIFNKTEVIGALQKQVYNCQSQPIYSKRKLNYDQCEEVHYLLSKHSAAFTFVEALGCDEAK